MASSSRQSLVLIRTVSKYFFRMSPLGRFFHPHPLMELPSPETKLRRSLGSDIEFAKNPGGKGPFGEMGQRAEII